MSYVVPENGQEVADHFCETPLSNDSVQKWRSGGFVAVNGIFPPETWASAQQEVNERLPKTLEASQEFTVTGGMAKENCVEFPSGWPFSTDAGSTHACTESNSAFLAGGTDALPLHPRLMSACSQLLDVPISELELTQCETWVKFGGGGGKGSNPADNQDQRIHMDYPNHNLLHPTAWDSPEVVSILVYFDDEEECGGATAVVDKEHADDPNYQWPYMKMPGVWGDVDWINDRTTAENAMRKSSPEVADFRSLMYDKEQYVKYIPGTVVLYRQDTWHRGTPLKPGTSRRAANITIAKKSARGRICNWGRGWASEAYRLDRSLLKLIGRLSPTLQRPGLGIPPPTSEFWDGMQIHAASARYGNYGWDPEPYLQQRRKRQHQRLASITCVCVGVVALSFGLARKGRSLLSDIYCWLHVESSLTNSRFIKRWHSFE